MKDNYRSVILAFIIFGAFLLRAFPLNWDGGYYPHPDEAHIYNMVFQLELPLNFSSFFTAESSLNPKFFAYGSFPLYLLKGLAHLIGGIDPSIVEYGNLYKVGRPLSALFDIGTLILLLFLSRKIFRSTLIGVLAMAVYALSVFPIQNAHFYTVDGQMVFWMMGTLLLILHYTEDGKKKYLLWASVTTGMAVATKFTAVILIPFLVASIVYRYLISRNMKENTFTALQAKELFIAAAGLFLITNFVLQPYAYIDFETFSNQIGSQLDMRSDATVFPYTIQYIDTVPFLYPIVQIFKWGLGPSFTFLGVIGMIALAYSSIIKTSKTKRFEASVWFVLFFSVPFLSLGSSAVKFMRYYLPLYPLLAMSAAYVGVHILHIRSLMLQTALTLLIVIPSMWWTIAFISIYTKPHTWIQASEWIHSNIPGNATLGVEHWDRSLPLYDSEYYQHKSLELYIPDSPAKITQLVQTLDHVEYIIIASNRLYDSIPNLPDQYPATIEYYKLLFDGTLGFSKVKEITSYPNLFGFSRNDQQADESFTVYDHPRVQIFKKTAFDATNIQPLLYNKLR